MDSDVAFPLADGEDPMKVVILCGGMGTRLREETEFRPKPMIEIGGHPILWHIMKTYGAHGFKDFVLCLGYKGEMIRQYFLQYRHLTADLSIDLSSQEIEIHEENDCLDWRVTFVNTGLKAMTGARVKRIASYVEGMRFMLTYGDGVTNLDLHRLLEFHRAHGKIGTVTGVTPPSRYGELAISGDRVLTFAEKPARDEMEISGGYFVFEPAFLEYLDDDDGCVLEREPLERLAREGELMVYHHSGFWQCMDTYRDHKYLQGLWEGGKPEWKIWDD